MTSSIDRCVVCAVAVDPTHALYPNAWEATVKTRLCCSEACRSAFDPDRHWMPSRAPHRADPTDESRLVMEAHRRLARGDSARTLVRELLCAGVTIDAIEHLLRMGEVRVADARHLAETTAPVEAVGSFIARGPLAAIVSLFRGASKRAALDRVAEAERASAIDDITVWRTTWTPADAASNQQAAL